MNDNPKVCGWCGLPLDRYVDPPEHAETCEQVYGTACAPALDYQLECNYRDEQHPDYIDESEES